MKIKTKWFGSITISDEGLQTLKGILQDAAAYNLEKGYIKVHGDLMEEIENIDIMLYISEVYNEQKPQRNIPATSRSKRSAGTKQTTGSKKQTRVHKESDNK